MEVKIKNLDAEMSLKAKGMCMEVKAPNGKTVAGTLCIGKSGLVWTKGKTATTISWKKFIECAEAMNAPKPAAKAEAAPKAAKAKKAKKTAKKKAAKKAVVPAAE